jgi:hypothetical protein
MSSAEGIVDKEVPETNIDAEKEDQLAEESERTGVIPQGESTCSNTADDIEEVEGLKDSIGGGQVLDDSEGYTRSSNKDNNAYKQEQEVDAAVDKLE